MTEERLVLAELLEKAGDGDFLRTWRKRCCNCWWRVTGAVWAQRRARHLAQRLPRPFPRHSARRTAAAHPQAAARQLFPAVSRSP